jgi:hypothetical protein
LLSLAAAADLMDGFGSGMADPAVLLDRPAVLVDADSGGDTAALEVPAGFPGVVIAVSRTAAPILSARGPDVAITGLADPPPPWVGLADPPAAAAVVAERVAASPSAAVTLVHVLRAGPARNVDDGLVLESLAYSMLQAGPEFSRWLANRGAPRHRPPGAAAVLVSRAEDRLELTLDRPEVHNAYNRQMRDELYEALAVAAADPSASVLLRGAGPSFCSGGDLTEFGTAPDPVTAHVVRVGRSPARLLARLSARVEAHIHGSCAGSGIELPAFAGVVRADPGTRAWLPELAMGLIPGAGGTVSLPRRIGAGRTAWMGLSGQAVEAATLLRWGLIDEISGQGE